MKFACTVCARASDQRRCPEHRKKSRPTQPQERFRKAVLRRDDYTCQQCGRRLPSSELEADHITPYAEGGPDHPENGQTLCRECHRGSPIRRTLDDEPLVA